jgi:predicted cytidylate kinase
MLKICISGLTGSGKTQLSKDLAKALNIAYISKELSNTYKQFNKGKRSANEQIIQMADPKYAKSFDNEIKELAASKDCVVSTWLGPWIVKNATLRVWLNASFEERARRKSVQKKMSIDEAKKYVKKKDSVAIESFKKIYGIDIMDHSNFDIEINTEKIHRKGVIALIALASAEKSKFVFR